MTPLSLGGPWIMNRLLRRCAISTAIILALPTGQHFALGEVPQADSQLVSLCPEADGNRSSSLRFASVEQAALPQTSPALYQVTNSENPLRPAVVATSAVAIETETLPQIE